MSHSAEVPLSPTLFLDRAASAFADRTAIVDGDRRFTYREFLDRSRRLAGALAAAGIRPGDRVAALSVNSHVMLELHNGVPIAGAVLVPLNIRLAVSEIVSIVKHSGASVLVATAECGDAARAVVERCGISLWLDGLSDGEYEERLQRARPHDVGSMDERLLLAINYTSGSTGRPKGVMYSHRGAYLQALAVAYHARLGTDSRYLWTLPMFHCNGWCFTWAVTAAGATHVCPRHAGAATWWRLLCEEEITHMSAAPTVLTMMAEAAAASDRRPRGAVHVDTGGAPPSPALLSRLASLQMHVTHLYGLTETYGPSVVNVWQPEWSARPAAEQFRLNARQGVGNITTVGVAVVDAAGRPVPADGVTLGEIVLRGNNVMLGYYRDDDATRAALADGWLRTGDLGVRHVDGYIELKDRAKDIIISGGENVASVEVERTLLEHEAVLEAAVVGRSDKLWGEVPVAFVTLKPGHAATEAELIDFVRGRIAHFKAPRAIRFQDLPKTSTGKVQKHLLRMRINEPSHA